jgi:hypothetical protein
MSPGCFFGSYLVTTNGQNRTKSLCSLVSRMAVWWCTQAMPLPSLTYAYKVLFYSSSQNTPPTTIAWNNSWFSVLPSEQITSPNTTFLSSSPSLVSSMVYYLYHPPWARLPMSWQNSTFTATLSWEKTPRPASHFLLLLKLKNTQIKRFSIRRKIPKMCESCPKIQYITVFLD